MIELLEWQDRGWDRADGANELFNGAEDLDRPDAGQQSGGQQSSRSQMVGQQGMGQQGMGQPGMEQPGTGQQNTGQRSTGGRNFKRQNARNQNAGRQNISHQNTGRQNTGQSDSQPSNTRRPSSGQQDPGRQDPPSSGSPGGGSSSNGGPGGGSPDGGSQGSAPQGGGPQGSAPQGGSPQGSAPQERKIEKEIEEKQDAKLEEYGQMTLEQNPDKKKIHLLSIIGEVEGHENLSGNAKATKYDHVLPQLAALEDDDSVQGLLVLLNTSGGDVDAGLAIAEMIASLTMPTVSLVLGGSHSIGVPLAVCTDYSFIVPTGTMMIHPVRMSGLVIGATQTYEYFEMIQNRILSFISEHAKCAYDQVKRLMLNTEMLTRDLGTVLVGKETVDHGLIDEVGGIKDALGKLYQMVEEREQSD